MTRNGKIARLPRTLRQELNQRLGDGEPGVQLVAWLNGLPEVKAVLRRDFGGRDITEQNLSEWKQGGFIDWQRHQETLECLRTAGEQAQELTAEAGVTPLTDVLSASVTLLLTRLIREASRAGESTPEGRRELMLMIREWTRLRSADQRAARLKMAQLDWVSERNREAEEAARELEEAERELAEAEEELARAQAYAESPEGRLAAFEKNFKAVDMQVMKETMDIRFRESMLDLACGVPDADDEGADPEPSRQLRELLESQIQERRDLMMEAFKREWKLPQEGTGHTKQGESDLIRPDPAQDLAEGGPAQDDGRPKSQAPAARRKRAPRVQ